MFYPNYALGLVAAGCLGYVVEIEEYAKKFIQKIRGKVQSGFVRKDDRLPTSSDIAQMLDLLVLSLSAGLSFDFSLAMYCSKFDNRLSRDMYSALFSWQIGATTRVDALEHLSGVYKDPSFERFVQCVVESIELGAPIAQTLESHSEMIRQTRRYELEEEIEKLPIKILIPLTTLILPAMLIAILGPIFAGLFN